MADIFISYKREDQEEHGRVRPIAEALRAEGYDVFYDVHVPPGSKWEDVLQGKIARARAVLVLWSAASVDSDWVKEEAEMAKAAGKLIPVMLDPVSPPFGFARIESANLADWRGDLSDIEWKNLVAAVKARIGQGEHSAQPGVTSVAYPRKQVTVSKQVQRGSGGAGMKGLLVGGLVLLVAAGGLIGVQMLDNGPPTSGPGVEATEATVAVSDTAAGDASAGVPPEAAAERAFDRARTRNSAKAYEAFAEQFPQSRLAEAARQRAAAIRRAEAEDAAAADYAGLSARTYRVAGVTMSRIEFSPAPPAKIVPGENISIGFNYRLEGARTARIWARPVHSGSGACAYGASGSPELTGSGRGQQRFSMTGSGCRNHRITGVRFSVQPDNDSSRADEVIVPVSYSFR